MADSRRVTGSQLFQRLRTALASRYALEREIGRGGMARVFLGLDLKHQRHVAIKFLDPEAAVDVGPARFLKEIRTAAGLFHPHILALHDSGEADGLLYYVMPYVAGESLAARLEREGRLSVGDALRTARQVAEALEYAHARGIIHRDIKPGNILFPTPRQACVADFGLAAALSDSETSRLTETGLTVGSPLYMAPEQIGGEPVDGRADFYSLGCVFFEMLTGRPPFAGPTVQALLRQHLIAKPVKIKSLRRNVPARLEKAIDRLLEKDPDDRSQGIAILLSRAAGEAPSKGEPESANITTRGLGQRPAASLRAHWVARAAALIVILLLAGVWWVARSPPSTANVAVGVVAGDDLGREVNRTEVYRLLAAALQTVPGIVGVESDGGGALHLTEQIVARSRGDGRKYVITAGLATTAPLRLVLELYETESGARLLREFAGRPGEPALIAIQRVGLTIARRIGEREGLPNPLPKAVAAASTSPFAIQAFMAGQQHFAAGDFSAAAESFHRAIEADSGFGPAYHRLAVVESWDVRENPHAAILAIDAGLRVRDSFDPLWNRMLEAQRHYVLRDRAAATFAFQRLAVDYPAVSDGWLGLAETIYHSGGFWGEDPLAALPAFQRVAQLDSLGMPAWDHMVDLVIRARDENRARELAARIQDPQSRRTRELAIDLTFGTNAEIERVERDLAAVPRVIVSWLVTYFLDRPERIDALGQALLTPNRTADDRLRGGQYRLIGLAAQGRWDEAVAAWEAAGGSKDFDSYIIHADLAGYPADHLTAPMYRAAEAMLEGGITPDFSADQADSREAFRALLHRALLRGDSASVTALQSHLNAAAHTATEIHPELSAWQATLRARLALLAKDTATAIAALETSLDRVPWWLTRYGPLTDAAPHRWLLADLSIRTDAHAAARTWLDSFGATWAVGDALYVPLAAQKRTEVSRLRN